MFWLLGYDLTELCGHLSGMTEELHCLLMIFEIVGIGHHWLFYDYSCNIINNISAVTSY